MLRNRDLLDLVLQLLWTSSRAVELSPEQLAGDSCRRQEQLGAAKFPQLTASDCCSEEKIEPKPQIQSRKSTATLSDALTIAISTGKRCFLSYFLPSFLTLTLMRMLYTSSAANVDHVRSYPFFCGQSLKKNQIVQMFSKQ